MMTANGPRRPRNMQAVSAMRAKFPTAALATLELEGSWRDLAGGTASLVAFVKPRELEP